eukprot:SAG31_NODE_285_length_18479_cov_9.871980_6_plen_225_part_00
MITCPVMMRTSNVSLKILSVGLTGKARHHYSMHATLFATMTGAVDEKSVPGMGLAVVKALKAKGMKCSCMAAHWLLEGLYKIGWETKEAADYALDVITSNSEQSWLHMIAQGATTTMEAWTRDEKPNLTWSHPVRLSFATSESLCAVFLFLPSSVRTPLTHQGHTSRYAIFVHVVVVCWCEFRHRSTAAGHTTAGAGLDQMAVCSSACIAHHSHCDCAFDSGGN